MKKSVITFLALLFLMNVSARSFYDQLCAFNFNWKNHHHQAPEGPERVFTSDKEYIQAHLEQVLIILRNNPASDLSAKQFNSRMKLIHTLEGYRLVGKFPMNYYKKERIPVFIDEHQTHCAVGFLMQQTGNEALAQRIAAANNYVWVKDLIDPEVVEWQYTAGFSLDELKLIQGAYDSYMENAFILPNRVEIPQKPACITAYFDDNSQSTPEKRKNWKVWLNGEGENGVLNGKWEQNYSVDLPWIVGHYTEGKRSGKWEEYYQGTHQLCRTEYWENDKLNGVRTRFDRSNGRIIEEILFKDGIAVTKTNYEYDQGLKYVRKPIDSSLVWTELYTMNNVLLSCGQETVHNPGNLQWFQNIELTALNSISLASSRSIPISNLNGNNDLGYQGVDLYNTPPLVEYRKEGTWTFYPRKYENSFYYSNSIFALLGYPELKKMIGDYQQYDSIRVDFENDQVAHFYGYGPTDFIHLFVQYYDEQFSGWQDGIQVIYPIQTRGRTFQILPQVQLIGQYNRANQKIGEWKYFDRFGLLYKMETFIIPRDEEEVVSK